jgi:predicted nuclease of predicted toxin-antitoxin system
LKIVADESVDKQIVEKLRLKGHDVVYVAELNPGTDDEVVLSYAEKATALLLTADKDFGVLVFRQRLAHSGVLLIRLAGLDADRKAELVVTTFDEHAEELRARFGVLTRSALRLRGRRP